RGGKQARQREQGTEQQGGADVNGTMASHECRQAFFRQGLILTQPGAIRGVCGALQPFHLLTLR
ncbi:MAG: hypothetical protein Q4D19_09290, partial [Lautropia sp.]|nr:hypothetical protein [Lautropia sp.]